MCLSQPASYIATYSVRVWCEDDAGNHPQVVSACHVDVEQEPNKVAVIVVSDATAANTSANIITQSGL